jgi:protein-tyrosine phosphatase
MAVEVRELHGAWNFRDVSEWTTLRPGRLFRSSELSRLEDAGREQLRELGVLDVVDLRSPPEVERRGPGLVPAGVDVHLLPFPDIPTAVTEPTGDAPHEHAFQRMMTEKPDDETVIDAAVRYMTDEYQRFATLKGAQQAVRRVVSLLTEGRPVLAHCFAGKDRTGFTVAVVLEAAGVGREAITADYLRSNAAVPRLRARILEMIQERAEDELTPAVVEFTEARLSDEVLGVREEYLVAGRRTIDETYGSLDGYLRDAGVTDADVDRLRAALLG